MHSSRARSRFKDMTQHASRAGVQTGEAGWASLANELYSSSGVRLLPLYVLFNRSTSTSPMLESCMCLKNTWLSFFTNQYGGSRKCSHTAHWLWHVLRSAWLCCSLASGKLAHIGPKYHRLHKRKSESVSPRPCWIWNSFDHCVQDDSCWSLQQAQNEALSYT